MHHLQRAVGVGRVRTLISCVECAGSASENSLRGRLRDVCKPRESRLSCQLTRLEQGFRLGSKMEKWQDRGDFCAWEAGTPITKSEFQCLCGFHDEGTFMAQCGYPKWRAGSLGQNK